MEIAMKKRNPHASILAANRKAFGKAGAQASKKRQENKRLARKKVKI